MFEFEDDFEFNPSKIEILGEKKYLQIFFEGKEIYKK